MRQTRRFPVDIRSAVRTEVKRYGEATWGLSLVASGGPLYDLNQIALVERRNTERAASSPLALHAVAH